MTVDIEAVNAANAPLPDEIPLPQAEEPKPETEEAQDDKATTEAEAEDADAEEEADDKSESDEDDGEADKPKRKRPGKYARQITRLEAERDELRRTVAALTQGNGPKAEPAEQQQTTDQPPKQEDFASYEDFLVAKAEHKIRQEQKAEQRKAEAEKVQRTQAEKVRHFQADADAARDKYSDFDDVFQGAIITEPMAAAIFETERQADIAYYLGKHPDEAQRIAQMSPAAQAVAIGKLETKLSAPPAKKTTAAPKPVKPVAGADTARKDPGKMSFAEYESWRREGGR